MRNMKLSKAQRRLVEELRAGRILFESNGGDRHSLSYETAEIRVEYAHCYYLPTSVHKQTVWVVLSLGLLKEIRVWSSHCNPITGYILSDEADAWLVGLGSATKHFNKGQYLGKD